MTNLVFALTTALADVAPSERVIRGSSVFDGIGVLVACLAGGAAVVVAAALLVWRRRGRGVNPEGAEETAVRHAPPVLPDNEQEQGAGT